jgi:hypothetical protein
MRRWVVVLGAGVVGCRNPSSSPSPERTPAAGTEIAGAPLPAIVGAAHDSSLGTDVTQAKWTPELGWTIDRGPIHDHVVESKGLRLPLGERSMTIERHDAELVIDLGRDDTGTALPPGPYRVGLGKSAGKLVPRPDDSPWQRDEREAETYATKTLRVVGHQRDHTGLWIGLKSRDLDFEHAAPDERALAVMDPAHAISLAATGGSAIIRAGGKERADLDARLAGFGITDDGTLVVLTDGTMAGGFSDAQLLSRAPGATSWRLLADQLDSAGGLIVRGPWACFETLAGPDHGDAAIHCVMPATSRHLVVPVSNARVYVQDLAPSPWRAVYFQINIGKHANQLRELPLEPP